MSEYDFMRLRNDADRLNPGAIASRFVSWLLICGMSSIAAMIWAAQLSPDWWGIACGIIIFAIAYTAITSTRTFAGWLRSRYVHRSLWITYASRVAVSIIFPVGMAIDLFPGLLATSIVGATHRDSPFRFGATFATTLLTGLLMHVVLAMYFGIVYGLARLTMRDPDAEPRGHGFQVLPVAPQTVLPVDTSSP